MEPAEALGEIASLLALQRDAGYRQRRGNQRAAKAIADIPDEELRRLDAAGRLGDIPGIGDKTAAIISDALTGKVPDYLIELRSTAAADPSTEEGRALQQALRGDLHLHSDWSDGGDTILAMATKAKELGHEYIALTDHSPRLTVAHGLSVERLRDQLDVVAEVNREVAPFRLLTGAECDILDDGALDGDPEVLAQLDVVVASVHSKLRMERQPMTERMLMALANPYMDILGHLTGRMVTGRGRPESEFDADLVFAAAHHFDKAIEVNCRPERLDPPRRMLDRIVELDVKVAIDTDAHATFQLDWHPYGCARAAERGVPVERVVNSWPLDDLLAWTTSHRRTAVPA